MDRESGSPTDSISSTVMRGEIPNSCSATSKPSRVFSPADDSSRESKSLRTDDKRGRQQDRKSNVRNEFWPECFSQVEVLHEIRPISMNQRTESETILPRGSEVSHIYATVTTSLLLTPSQQLIGPRDRICHRGPIRREHETQETDHVTDVMDRRTQWTHRLGGIWGTAGG